MNVLGEYPRGLGQDKLGQTPLSHAAYHGHEAVVKLLLTQRKIWEHSDSRMGVRRRVADFLPSRSDMAVGFCKSGAENN
jgi:ankyrin repeat protein